MLIIQHKNLTNLLIVDDTNLRKLNVTIFTASKTVQAFYMIITDTGLK